MQFIRLSTGFWSEADSTPVEDAAWDFYIYIKRWLLVEQTLLKDNCKVACVPVVMGNTCIGAGVSESI